jgi:hypothetical protein
MIKGVATTASAIAKNSPAKFHRVFERTFPARAVLDGVLST